MLSCQTINDRPACVFIELFLSVPKMVSAAPSLSDAPRVNRRKFLVGGWYDKQIVHRFNAPASQDRAAIVIHARPERLNEIKRAVDDIHGLAVKGQNSDGRLIVVVTPDTPEHVSVALLSLMDVPGVVNAVLADDNTPASGENA